jgi:hypothetical protein
MAMVAFATLIIKSDNADTVNDIDSTVLVIVLRWRYRRGQFPND